MAGSFLPALLWGVGWANIVHGVPIDRHGSTRFHAGPRCTIIFPDFRENARGIWQDARRATRSTLGLV